MSVINFEEIPAANTGNGDQDTFELFARDFIKEVLGLEILSPPNRGADGGKDLIAEEIRCGALGNTRIRWLVSCKHFAHSKKSVSDKDDDNISDRLDEHNANGFIGFYSTLPSSGLGRKLDHYKSKYEVRTFDCMDIERELLGIKNTTLIERYFPLSYAAWKASGGNPTVYLDKYEPLTCSVCGKDLLVDRSGIIVFLIDIDRNEIIDAVAVCRGACDYKYTTLHKKRGRITKWGSIQDFIIPTIYVKKYMALINSLFYKKSDQFTKESLEKYKDILLSLGVFHELCKSRINTIKIGTIVKLLPEKEIEQRWRPTRALYWVWREAMRKRIAFSLPGKQKR